MFVFCRVSITKVWFSVILALLISQLCWGNLSNFFDEVEIEIDNLAAKTLSLHREKCSVTTSLDCTSAFEKNSFACTTDEIEGEGSYCSSDQGIVYYTSKPGCSQCKNRRLNEASSLVRTASGRCTCQDVLNADMCWSKGIEEDFKNTNLPGLLWQQIATTNGFTRLYPGAAQEECYSYDPRLRAWFVAASAGPKDVVILIDSSSSMSLVPKGSQTIISLMQLAIRAVRHVLSTLTFVDYMAVARFSTESEQVTVNDVYTLIQATRDNISALIEQVNNIQPEGHTNFEQAFRLAFRLLDRSASIGRTTGCNKAILFMTDGSPTRGEDDPTRLARLVDGLNTRPDGSKIASIFTYSISDVAEKDISKKIACRANGVWSQVETGTAASLQEQLSQYYEYYSTLHKGPSGTIWTEPYLDAFGADMVVTAAKSVYESSNTSQSSLVAVLAIDISYAYIQQLESNRAEVMAELQRRQDFCPNTAMYSKCELEVLRQKVYAEGSVSYESNPEKICDASTTCTLPADTACPNRTFQYEKCSEHSQATQDFIEAACCGMFLPCSSSNVPSVTTSPLLTAFVTLLLAVIISSLL